MKKTYMAPQMEQVTMKDMLPLCASGVGGSGIPGAPGYGGVDTGGGVIPAAKEMPDSEDLEGELGLNGLLW